MKGGKLPGRSSPTTSIADMNRQMLKRALENTFSSFVRKYALLKLCYRHMLYSPAVPLLYKSFSFS